ncbi:hypothetical protein PG996_015094 [Apiospora saccharicola]|uniref:SnoaL-like domain-containing protein n=1 Tax=Apiospora saccharicola TaxID=335842 RepID=A0ABR1TM80_9PEZI
MPRSRFSIHGGVPLTAATPTTTTKTVSTSSSSSSLAPPTATYSLFPSDPFTGRSYSAKPAPRTRPRTNTKSKDPRPPSISLPPRPASVSLPHIAMLLNKPLPSSPTRKSAPASSSGGGDGSENGSSSSSSKATNDRQPSAPAPTFANSDDMLRWLYADLTRISQIATPDIILHRVHDHSRPLRGAAAAQAHEEGLVAAAGGTLVMEVDQVSSNEHFGTVMGTLRAQSRHKGVPDLAAPFCGVWRFDGKGKLAEHWENVAVDPDQVAQWFENNPRQQQ